VLGPLLAVKMALTEGQIRRFGLPELARKASGLKMHCKTVFFIIGFGFLSSFDHKILFLGPVLWVNLVQNSSRKNIFFIFRIYFYLFVQCAVQCDSTLPKTH
jgi:hypothetical protein